MAGPPPSPAQCLVPIGGHADALRAPSAARRVSIAAINNATFFMTAPPCYRDESVSPIYSEQI
jgi:hypothetical protein